MIESELRTAILNISGMSTLISNRCHPVDLPQGVTIPAVVFTKISDVPKAQDHNWKSGVWELDYQIDCYALDPTTAKSIADLIVQFLHGSSTTSIKIMRVTNSRDMSDPAINNFWVSIDLEMLIQRTV